MTAPKSRRVMDCTSPPPPLGQRRLRERTYARAQGAVLAPPRRTEEVNLVPAATKRGRGRLAVLGDGLELDVHARHVAPQLLEPVELAHLGDEDVDDDVEVVHEDPARLAGALDAARELAVVLLEALADRVVDRLGLTVGVARADDEEVRVARHAAQVEHGEVDGLLVGRVGRGELREALGGHLWGLLIGVLHGLTGQDDASSEVMLMMGYPQGSGRARAARCTRRPCRAPGTGSDGRRPPAAGPARTRRPCAAGRRSPPARPRRGSSPAVPGYRPAARLRARRRRGAPGPRPPRARATSGGSKPCRLRR